MDKYNCGICDKPWDTETEALKCCYAEKVKNGSIPEPIICPDCGKPVRQVVVETYHYRTYNVDYAKKELTPVPNEEEWSDGDSVIRCKDCDTLNMSEYFDRFMVKESEL